jgi:hypothetical protein
MSGLSADLMAILPWLPPNFDTLDSAISFFFAYLSHVLPGEPLPLLDTLLPSPPAPLAGAVTEKHAALGAVWAHREEFKRFSLHVGAPALRAHGLDGAAALLAELERSVTLPVRLVPDSTALRSMAAAADGSSAAAGMVEDNTFVLSVRAPTSGSLHLRLLHLRFRGGDVALERIGTEVPAGAATELLAFPLPKLDEGGAEGGARVVEAAHLVVMQAAA